MGRLRSACGLDCQLGPLKKLPMFATHTLALQNVSSHRVESPTDGTSAAVCKWFETDQM